MNLSRQLPRLIVNSLIAVLAVLGTLLCVSTAFELAVNLPIFIVVSVCSSLLFSACFLWKKVLWALIPLAAAILLLGLLTGLFSEIGLSFRQLGHDILTRFSSAYPNFSFAIPAAPDAAVTSYTALFCAAAVLLSVWMAWGVGFRSCIISIAGTLPFVLLCVVINDTPPHAAPLVLLLAAWLTVLFARRRAGEPPSLDAARVCLTMMAVLLFLSIVGTVYPKEDTSGRELPQAVQNIVDHLPGPMQNMLSRDSSGFQNDELGADTSEILDLTTQGTRNRSDTVMMQLSCTESGVLYLRGAAKDIYTGSSWESRGDASVSDSVYAHTSLGSAFGDVSQAAVQIRNYYDDPSVAFTPYGFLSCTGTGDIVNDLRVPCTQDDYIIYYWPGLSSLNLEEAAGTVNESYDSYVADTCLDLPDDTRETLRDLALSSGYDERYDTLETIAWVVDFVRSSANYQLNVSRQPINYDFAVYFLTESQAGYCVHFATATAVMLRALGVPARYASGYRVTVTEAGGVTDVTDRETHAWAEVYLSGLGWIPVESTPGFGSSIALPDLEREPESADDAAEPSPAPEEADAPAETEESAPEEPDAEPPADETENAQPEEEPPASDSPESDSDAPAVSEEAGSAHSRLLLLLWVPAVLVLLLLAAVLRRDLIRRRRNIRFQSGSSNQQVIVRWAYVEKLIPWGAAPPKELEQLGLKAKFSRHEITPEELASCTAAVEQLSVSVQNGLTRRQKLSFRWLHCLEL